MSFQIESKTFKWLNSKHILSTGDVIATQKNTFEVSENVANQFQNGIKMSHIVAEIYKKKGIPVPSTLNHLKQSNNTAAQLYNWGIINQALKKFKLQIDSDTKSLIVNGDRSQLEMIIRKLIKFYGETQEDPDLEDSLETAAHQLKLKQQQQANYHPETGTGRQSLSLSKSEDMKINANKNLQNMVRIQQQKHKPKTNEDLLQFILSQLMDFLKLTRKQAIALLSQNNKYLAHVLVKGIKGQFQEIQLLMEKLYKSLDYIIQKMIQHNDMCFFFLQVVKPALLSKSEDVAQWACRILSKVAYQLAERDMLPLAYDWFIRQAGGLSTTILSLSRHPNLSHHVVGFIVQFSRYNVSQLFTIQLKKITNNDNSTYIKFILMIFQPLVQSKSSADELLNSGAVDYWIQVCLKGAQMDPRNTLQYRMICIELLIKIWRAYPTHIQQSHDKVNSIMTYIKRNIRQSSQIIRFNLVQLLFSLLDQFAGRKNPYASIVYKKLTFLFIENHEQLTMREFMLRNFQNVFEKYQSIPVQIFLQPFVKQVKISENKSYMLNMFDFEFVNVAVKHKKLKVNTALQIYDLLAKTLLNSYTFSKFVTESMQILMDRFLADDIFHQYTVKLVKISLAMFYSTLKNKKPYEDQEILQAQKRAEIVNFIIGIIQRGKGDLNEQIKDLVVHVKAQIRYKLGGKDHKGIQRILGYFSDVDFLLQQAMQNVREQTDSNATSTKSKNQFHLPRINAKSSQQDRDELTSQQSFKSSGSKISRQQFPAKDYTQFATQDEQKFLKQHGLGLKKKGISARRPPSYDKQIDQKLKEQIMKQKQRKQQQAKKKLHQQELLERKKQLLKKKMQKQLQQRNLKQGYKGGEKDVQVKVLFEENQINEKILEEDDHIKLADLNIEEQRNSQSVKLVIHKHANFLKKVFNRYASANVKRQDFYSGEAQNMNQIDLIRLCKEKNLQKSKQNIIDLLKTVTKNTQSIDLQDFFNFLQVLCISSGSKDKFTSRQPLGQHMAYLLKKIAYGQNFKLLDDQDPVAKKLTNHIKQKGHIDIPQNYKKIQERTYTWKNQLTYPVQKALGPKAEKYMVCYSVVNDILKEKFGLNLITEQVRFLQQIKVVPKKQAYLPPKIPIKKEPSAQIRLKEKQTVPKALPKKSNISEENTMKRTASNRSMQKQNKTKEKIPNAAEKKKQQQEQQQRIKRQKQQEIFKKRRQQVKKQLEQKQLEQQRQKERKKQSKKEQQQKQIQRKRKEKQQKEKYRKQQKEKLEKYRKEQQSKEKEQKQKENEEKAKEEQQRKQKFKQMSKKEEEKRKEEFQRMKKQRQEEEERERKKKEEEEKKKELLKKQVMKKLENQKEKQQTVKLQKQMLKQLSHQPQIQAINSKHKDQLKGLFNYGKQYNEFKLDQANQAQNQLGQKGWITICQQFSICDPSTANKILKQNTRAKNNGFTLEELQEVLLQFAIKKDLQKNFQDYEGLKSASAGNYETFLSKLKIPKDKQLMKDFFANLKTQQGKKNEMMNITGPNGQNQTWQIDN